MFVADGGGRADFSYEPERVSSNVGTARLVAQIFGEQFFAPVWRLEARLDGYLRNMKCPHHYIEGVEHLLQTLFWVPAKLSMRFRAGPKRLQFTPREPFLNGG